MDITYPFFSTPKSAAAFATEILDSFDNISVMHPQRANRQGDRTFDGQTPKGGLGIDPLKCAILCIEFQNEFTTEGKAI